MLKRLMRFLANRWGKFWVGRIRTYDDGICQPPMSIVVFGANEELALKEVLRKAYEDWDYAMAAPRVRGPFLSEFGARRVAERSGAIST